MPEVLSLQTLLGRVDVRMEVLARDLKVMDGAAIALARDNDLPVIVFSIEEAGNLLNVLEGAARSTIISSRT